MDVNRTNRCHPQFIGLKYYAILQIPLALIVLFYFVVPELFGEKEVLYFYGSLIISTSFLFARIVFCVLFFKLYKLLSQEKYGMFCYVLLFMGLFDFVLGTFLSIYTVYLLFKKRKENTLYIGELAKVTGKIKHIVKDENQKKQ